MISNQTKSLKSSLTRNARILYNKIIKVTAESNFCDFFFRGPWESCLSGNLNISKAEVFDVGVLLDSIMGALSADAGLLDPAERCLGSGYDAFVDADHAHFQSLGHPPHLGQVVAVEVAGQTRTSSVGDGQNLLFSFKPGKNHPVLNLDEWSL